MRDTFQDLSPEPLYYTDPGNAPGDDAAWQFSALEAGTQYEIFVEWSPTAGGAATGKATDATYTIVGAATITLANSNSISLSSPTTVIVNQQADPLHGEVFGSGKNWQSLGVFVVDDNATPNDGLGKLDITLADQAGGMLVAGEMRVVKSSATTFTYYANYDLIESVADALGNVTTYQYDDRLRLTTITESDPGNGSPVTQYTYDAADQLLTEVDPLGNMTRYRYDELGRTSFVARPIRSVNLTDLETIEKNAIDYPGPGAAWTSGASYDTHDGQTSASAAEWTISDLDSGTQYEVFVEWDKTASGVSATDNASDAIYSLYDGTSSDTLLRCLFTPTIPTTNGVHRLRRTMTEECSPCGGEVTRNNPATASTFVTLTRTAMPLTSPELLLAPTHWQHHDGWPADARANLPKTQWRLCRGVGRTGRGRHRRNLCPAP